MYTYRYTHSLMCIQGPTALTHSLYCTYTLSLLHIHTLSTYHNLSTAFTLSLYYTCTLSTEHTFSTEEHIHTRYCTYTLSPANTHTLYCIYTLSLPKLKRAHTHSLYRKSMYTLFVQNCVIQRSAPTDQHMFHACIVPVYV